MYVAQSDACTAPNSTMPASKAQIMRGVRMLGSMEMKVRNARQAFNCLLYRGDLNTNGWPIAQFGGIPSSTITGCPSPTDSGQSSGSTFGVNMSSIQSWPTVTATLPIPTAAPANDAASVPQPPPPVVPPLTTAQHSRQARRLVNNATAAATPVPTTAPNFPTTGNVCLDLRLNYIDQSQVSPQQLFQCAMKGYSGISNGPALTPAMVAWRNANPNNLPQIPDQPNVPEYTPAIGKPYGLGDFDGGSFLAGLAAAVGLAAGTIYLFNFAKDKGFLR